VCRRICAASCRDEVDRPAMRWYGEEMPLYEYRCNDCASVFELLRPMAERSVSAVCPGCESRSAMPLISRVAAGPADLDAGLPAADRAAPAGGGGCCGGGCGCG